jgi:Protein of unknown function (DUF2934)
MAKLKDLYEARKDVPTHDEIAKRAYELYRKNGEEFSPIEYWLKAEEELRRERSKH